MNPTRLVFWRHGESEYNRSRRIQGTIDVRLSPLGTEQAQAAAVRLADFSPLRVFSSDLTRARQTAEQLATLVGGSVSTDERFRERGLGEWEDMSYDALLEQWPHALEVLRGSRASDSVPSGGEHPDTVVARVLDGLADALGSTAPGETLVITAHGLAILYAVRNLIGDADAAGLKPLSNAHWTVLERADREAPWRLIDHNSGAAVLADDAAKDTTVTPPRRRTNRRSHVVDVAEKLFSTTGYSNTSVEDIARAAGLTRPVIYQYFGSKEGLLIECIRRARAQLHEHLEAAGVELSPDVTPYELWKLRGDTYFRTVEANPGLWALVYSNDTTLSGGLALEVGRLREGTILSIADRLRAMTDADEELLLASAYAISGIGEQLVRLWQRNPDIPRARLAEHYAAIVSGGLTALGR
ncbi:histidine phosphatase family protein [Mycetocola sp.]|uniref:histidine phosphatase family protein n=1 Tax=Mycetocola sp. TaxID=1871042 RepID=UPI0039892F57